MTPGPSVTAPWMTIAEREIGVAETPGPGDTPRIVAYHQATTLAARDDEVPWCAAFVGWVLREAGIAGTGSAAARSYVHWGIACPPQYGAVVVLRRGEPWQGHVGFYVRGDATRVWVLGGNQSNRVSIAPYPTARIVASRWPHTPEGTA